MQAGIGAFNTAMKGLSAAVDVSIAQHLEMWALLQAYAGGELDRIESDVVPSHSGIAFEETACSRLRRFVGELRKRLDTQDSAHDLFLGLPVVDESTDGWFNERARLVDARIATYAAQASINEALLQKVRTLHAEIELERIHSRMLVS